MKNILSIFKESKLSLVIIATFVLVVVGVGTVVFLNSEKASVTTTSEGVVYNDVGEIPVPSQTTITPNWDDTITVDGKTSVPGSPIVYGNGSLVTTEPGLIVFSNKEDIVSLPPFSTIEVAGGYSVENEEGLAVEANEMIVKTEKEFYIFFSPTIRVTSAGQEVLTAENVLVTQIMPDGTVTIYSETSKGVFPNDLIVTTTYGSFDFSTLIYTSEVITDLSNLIPGGLPIDDSLTAEEDKNGDGIPDNEQDSDGDGIVDSEDTTPLPENTTTNETPTDNAETGNQIIGLSDFIDAVIAATTNRAPKIETTVVPGYTTATVTLRVKDDNKLLNGQLNVNVAKVGGTDIGITKSVDPGDVVTVTFEGLEPNTTYNVKVTGSYSTNKGDVSDALFYSGTVTTSTLNIDITIFEQTPSSITYNVKTYIEQEITALEITTFEGSSETNGMVNTVDINESNKPEGQNITIDSLKSNTPYDIEVTYVEADGVEVATEQVITAMTLKELPIINVPTVIPVSQESTFEVRTYDMVDVDKSVFEIKYNMYKDGDGDGEYDEFVTSVTKDVEDLNEPGIFFADGSLVVRETPYTFSASAVGYNNVNEFEVESAHTQPVVLVGIDPPKAIISYDAVADVSPSSITVDVEILDPQGAIVSPSQKSVLTVYKGSTEIATYPDLVRGMNMDITFDGLDANTTYKFEVTATVDTQDGNGAIENTVIGSTTITTKDVDEINLDYVADLTCLDPVTSCVNESDAMVKITASGTTTTLEALDSAEVTFNDRNPLTIDATIVLTPAELDLLITTGVSVSSGINSLTSNTVYSIDTILKVGATEVPVVDVNTRSFKTKAKSPEINTIETTYNPNTLQIEVKPIGATDPDNSFHKIVYELYETDAAGVPLSTIPIAVSPDLDDFLDITYYFGDENFQIPTGAYYVVQPKMQYIDYYDSLGVEHIVDVTLPLTPTPNPVLVQYVLPTATLSNVASTATSYGADVFVLDEEDTIAVPTVDLVITNVSTSEVVYTKSGIVPDQVVNFNTGDILLPKTNYEITIDTTVNLLGSSGPTPHNVLTERFRTDVPAGELPTFSNEDADYDSATKSIMYSYTVKDLNELSLYINIEVRRQSDGEVVYSEEQPKPGTEDGVGIDNSGAINLLEHKEILNDETYEIVPVSTYAEYQPINGAFVADGTTTYAISDEAAVPLFVTYGINGTNVSMAEEKTKNSQIEFIPGTVDTSKYKIRIGPEDAGTYFGLSGTNVIVVDEASATEFAVVPVGSTGSEYQIKTLLSGVEYYVTINEISGNLQVTPNAPQAQIFGLHKIIQLDGAETEIVIPPAEIPVYIEGADVPAVTYESFKNEYTVTDEWLTIVDGTMVGQVYERTSPNPTPVTGTDMPGEVDVLNSYDTATGSVPGTLLLPDTDYVFIVNAMVDLNTGDGPILTEIGTFEFHTPIKPPDFTAVLATWDAANREILITTDMDQSQGLFYDQFKIVITEGGSEIFTTGFIDCGATTGSVTSGDDLCNSFVLDFTHSELANVLANEAYTFSVQYFNSTYTGGDGAEISDLIDSPITSLNYDIATAAITTENLLDVSVDVSAVVTDDDVSIEPAMVPYLAVVPAGGDPLVSGDRVYYEALLAADGSTPNPVTGLSPGTTYDFHILAKVDEDGKQTVYTEQSIGVISREMLEKLPSFLVVVADYTLSTNTLRLTHYDPQDTATIDNVDVSIKNIDPPYAEVTAVADQTYADVMTMTLPIALTPGALYVVDITYNYVLTNGTTGFIQQSTTVTVTNNQLTIPEFKFVESDSGMDLGSKFAVDYYIEGAVVGSDETSELAYDSTWEYAYVTLSPEMKVQVDNPKYYPAVTPYLYEWVDDGYYVVATSDPNAVVTVQNQKPTQLEKWLGFDTKTYKGSQIERIKIPIEKLENYKVWIEVK